METLKDYFDNSLFNQAITNPLEYNGLLEKEKATVGLDTYSIDGGSQISEIPEGILIKGKKTQYWIGRNTGIDENLRDDYDYNVKLIQYDDLIGVEVEADVERFVGSDYWDIINIPTFQIATIPKENGRYHIGFEEYYSLKDDVLVHETNLSDKVEVYSVPEGFKLGDSFNTCEKFVFSHAAMQEEIKKMKEIEQINE